MEIKLYFVCWHWVLVGRTRFIDVISCLMLNVIFLNPFSICYVNHAICNCKVFSLFVGKLLFFKHNLPLFIFTHIDSLSRMWFLVQNNVDLYTNMKIIKCLSPKAGKWADTTIKDNKLPLGKNCTYLNV